MCLNSATFSFFLSFVLSFSDDGKSVSCFPPALVLRFGREKEEEKEGAFHSGKGDQETEQRERKRDRLREVLKHSAIPSEEGEEMVSLPKRDEGIFFFFGGGILP